MKTRLQVIRGQPSWRVATRDIEAYVTQQGGQLGPVTFDRRGRKLRPFSVAPWATETDRPKLPAILKVLRGDFFCLPFGGNATRCGREQHPIHGETANARWKLESAGAGSLHLSLATKIRRGRVDKSIELREDQPVVYQQHVIRGMTGPMNLGHHAMLLFPDRPGSGVISTSPFVYGQVFPDEFEKPAEKGYQSLQPGAEFTTLEQVPLMTGATTDLTRYPARRGFEDLVLLVADPTVSFAWTAVVFPRERYVWVALRDPRVLRSTVFWISNGGRHMPPWSGRHVNVMGLEDVTAYFHYGLAESARDNPLTARGYPTTVTLDPQHPCVVNYIMAVTAIPAGFDRVAGIEAGADGNSVTLRAAGGATIRVPLDLRFLSRGPQPG